MICPSQGRNRNLPAETRGIRGLPGVVAVVMDKPEERKGSILLPDNAAEDRPDSGTVLCAGPDTGFVHGEHVLVSPLAGIWFRNVVLYGYRFWEVRFYGIADLDEDLSIRYDPYDEIPVAVGGDTIEQLKPKGDWMLIKRDKNKTSQSGILLPDKSHYRTHKATVVSVGPKCTECEPGDYVMYHGPSIMIGFKDLISMIPGVEDAEDYCMIKESGIYCKL